MAVIDVLEHGQVDGDLPLPLFIAAEAIADEPAQLDSLSYIVQQLHSSVAVARTVALEPQVDRRAELHRAVAQPVAAGAQPPQFELPQNGRTSWRERRGPYV